MALFPMVTGGGSLSGILLYSSYSDTVQGGINTASISNTAPGLMLAAITVGNCTTLQMTAPAGASMRCLKKDGTVGRVNIPATATLDVSDYICLETRLDATGTTTFTLS